MCCKWHYKAAVAVAAAVADSQILDSSCAPLEGESSTLDTRRLTFCQPTSQSERFAESLVLDVLAVPRVYVMPLLLLWCACAVFFLAALALSTVAHNLCWHHQIKNFGHKTQAAKWFLSCRNTEEKHCHISWQFVIQTLLGYQKVVLGLLALINEYGIWI